MADFTFVGSTSDTGSSGNIDFDVSGISIQAGDLVVAILHANVASVPVFNDVSVAGGAAYQDVYATITDAPETASWAIKYKITNGSEPSDYVFDYTGSSRRGGTLYVFRPPAGVTVTVDAQDRSYNGSASTNQVAGALTVGAETVSIATVFQDNEDVQLNPTVNQSYLQVEEAANQKTYSAYRINTTGGSTGGVTFTGVMNDAASWAHVSFGQTGGADTTAPVITLTGANPQQISQGGSYTELGAAAIDNVDGDISGSIVIDASAVNTAVVGSYSVTYNVDDAAGNSATEVVRTVNVVAPISTETIDLTEGAPAGWTVNGPVTYNDRKGAILAGDTAEFIRNGVDDSALVGADGVEIEIWFERRQLTIDADALNDNELPVIGRTDAGGNGVNQLYGFKESGSFNRETWAQRATSSGAITFFDELATVTNRTITRPVNVAPPGADPDFARLLILDKGGSNGTEYMIDGALAWSNDGNRATGDLVDQAIGSRATGSGANGSFGPGMVKRIEFRAAATPVTDQHNQIVAQIGDSYVVRGSPGYSQPATTTVAANWTTQATAPGVLVRDDALAVNNFNGGNGQGRYKALTCSALAMNHRHDQPIHTFGLNGGGFATTSTVYPDAMMTAAGNLDWDLLVVWLGPNDVDETLTDTSHNPLATMQAKLDLAAPATMTNTSGKRLVVVGMPPSYITAAINDEAAAKAEYERVKAIHAQIAGYATPSGITAEYIDSWPYFSGSVDRYFVGSDPYNDETAVVAGVGRRTDTLRGDVHGNVLHDQIRAEIFVALIEGKLGLAPFPETRGAAAPSSGVTTQQALHLALTGKLP